MAKTFHCSVITPEARVYEGEADLVVIPAHDGEIGILRDRAPLVCQLGSGRMMIQNGAVKESWFVDAGFAQVLDNNVIILTQRALRPEQIDRGEASCDLAAAQAMPTHDDVALRRRAKAAVSARERLRMAR